MMTSCDSVSERVALGEPVGELATHVAGCARCQRTVALPAQLGHAHREIDPGLGFAARMTAGAQHRIGVRRRRRIAAASGGTVAAAALAVFVFTRAPEPPQQAAVQPPPQEAPTELAPEELGQLVRMADTKRSRRLSAHWSRIQRPLAPYRALVQHGDAATVTPAVAPTVAPALPDGEEP